MFAKGVPVTCIHVVCFSETGLLPSLLGVVMMGLLSPRRYM